MIGIVSYGAYVPTTRLPLSAIGGRPTKEGGPEKAVAWNDEDAITLGVTAGIHCLEGIDRSKVDMLLFASTTLPFQEKQAAALAARVLDLPRKVQTADHGGSTRAGTTALRSAIDAVTAGSASCALVIMSDARMAAPGSGLEANFGDGAAAFLIADGDAIATLDAAASVTDEVTDVWRPSGHEFVHSWEDRFVIQESYTPNMQASIAALLETSGSKIGDYDRIAIFAPDARSHAGVARATGVPKKPFSRRSLVSSATQAQPLRRFNSPLLWKVPSQESAFSSPTSAMAPMPPVFAPPTRSRSSTHAAASPGIWRGDG